MDNGCLCLVEEHEVLASKRLTERNRCCDLIDGCYLRCLVDEVDSVSVKQRKVAIIRLDEFGHVLNSLLFSAELWGVINISLLHRLGCKRVKVLGDIEL